MPTILITTDFLEVERELNVLQEGLGTKALQQAMNRTIERGRTEMTRGITAEFNVKAGDARAQMRLNKVTRKTSRYDFEASLEAFGRRRGRRSRNVILFDARPAPGKGKKVVRFNTPQGWRTRTVAVGGGVSVKILKSGPRKVITGAFIGNKGRTVFTRVQGAGRLPIKAVETVDIPQMFNTRRINAKVVQRMGEIFDIEFDRATKLAISRWSKP